MQNVAFNINIFLKKKNTLFLHKINITEHPILHNGKAHYWVFIRTLCYIILSKKYTAYFRKQKCYSEDFYRVKSMLVLYFDNNICVILN